MRPPSELVAAVVLAWAAAAGRAETRANSSAARDARQVHADSYREYRDAAAWGSARPDYDSLPDDDVYFRLHQIYNAPFYSSPPPAASALPPPPAARAGVAAGLLTFGRQEPDPRLRSAVSILVIRQLPVEAFLDGSQPPPPPPPPGALPAAAPGGALGGLLTFGASPAPATTPRPWWRAPPPVPVAVRPRLGESAAEMLALGASPLVTRLHGPVAMGSGAVGYARLADGRLAIGSGSVGFAQFDVIALPSPRYIDIAAAPYYE